MFVDEEEVVEEAAAEEEVVAEAVEAEPAAEEEAATSDEESSESSDEEEVEDETVVKPAWQTEEHHLDAHALRRQAIMIGRPNQVAWAPAPSNAWALTQPIQPITHEYEEFEEDIPFNFIADPQVALDAMADYQNFQARMHRKLGTILD